MRILKIAPSILSADFSQLGEEIRRVEEAGADLIHFDVMDGHFVPNLSIGLPVLESIRRVTRIPIDVHLMIEEPQRYVEGFVRAGANLVSVHVEVCSEPRAMAALIRRRGAKASLAVNPETSLAPVLEVADAFDMILVMSVHPGFGGQGFIPESIGKLEAVRRELDRRGLQKIDLEVDGGIKLDNAAAVSAAGANVLVSGSGIFDHDDYRRVIAEMRRLGSSAGAAA